MKLNVIGLHTPLPNIPTVPVLFLGDAGTLHLFWLLDDIGKLHLFLALDKCPSTPAASLTHLETLMISSFKIGCKNVEIHSTLKGTNEWVLCQKLCLDQVYMEPYKSQQIMKERQKLQLHTEIPAEEFSETFSG